MEAHQVSFSVARLISSRFRVAVKEPGCGCAACQEVSGIIEWLEYFSGNDPSVHCIMILRG